MIKNRFAKILCIVFLFISLLIIICPTSYAADKNNVILNVITDIVPEDFNEETITMEIVNTNTGIQYNVILCNYNDFKNTVHVTPGNYIISSSKIGENISEKYIVESKSFIVGDGIADYLHINVLLIDDIAKKNKNNSSSNYVDPNNFTSRENNSSSYNEQNNSSKISNNIYDNSSINNNSNNNIENNSLSNTAKKTFFIIVSLFVFILLVVIIVVIFFKKRAQERD